MNRWLITAEHAGYDVPHEWTYLFDGHEAILRTHLGFDAGTMALTQEISALADATIIYPYTRLLIEVNRSIRHPRLFSSFTGSLSKSDKLQLIDHFYRPHWQAVQDQIQTWINEGDKVFHMGVHSFTPVWHGSNRKADIGLLYDPGKAQELEWATLWQEELRQKEFIIRRNFPYLGKADGLITQMRKLFPYQYVGIELEVNQKHVLPDGRFTPAISHTVTQSITAIQSMV